MILMIARVFLDQHYRRNESPGDLGLLRDDRPDYAWYAKDGTEDSRDRERRIEIARRIWNAAKDARGTPVERYLRSRGITVPSPLSLRSIVRPRVSRWTAVADGSIRSRCRVAEP